MPRQMLFTLAVSAFSCYVIRMQAKEMRKIIIVLMLLFLPGSPLVFLLLEKIIAERYRWQSLFQNKWQSNGYQLATMQN